MSSDDKKKAMVWGNPFKMVLVGGIIALLYSAFIVYYKRASRYTSSLPSLIDEVNKEHQEYYKEHPTADQSIDGMK